MVQEPRKKISPVAQQSFIFTFVNFHCVANPTLGVEAALLCDPQILRLALPTHLTGSPFSSHTTRPHLSFVLWSLYPEPHSLPYFRPQRKGLCLADDGMPPDDLSGYFLLSWAVSSFPIATLPCCKKDPHPYPVQGL